MLCYKDKSFCSRQCANVSCDRHKSHIDLEEVNRNKYLVSYTFYSDCEEYIPVIKIKNPPLTVYDDLI